MSAPDQSAGEEMRVYAIGYGLAMVLTCLAFGSVYWQWFDPTITLGIVFGVGFLQMIVHFVYFLHVNLRRSARDDLQLILFSTVIIALMAGGTVVILLNLRHRMM